MNSRSASEIILSDKFLPVTCTLWVCDEKRIDRSLSKPAQIPARLEEFSGQNWEEKCTGRPTAPVTTRYRCFLPDLAGLAGLRRVGPGTRTSLPPAAAHSKRESLRCDTSPQRAGLSAKGAATTPPSCTKCPNIPKPVQSCTSVEQLKSLRGHASIQTAERYLGSEPEIANAVNDSVGL